jgi:hypothetical protein
MILTEQTFPEQDDFFRLFEDCVDDVSIKQYTERGGKLSELDAATRARVDAALASRVLPENTPFFRDREDHLFVAVGRLPCEQPYQRLLVTYDGRASMCCYDWGSMHPVGYVDRMAIDIGETEYEAVLAKVQAGAKGFEAMPGVKLPHRFHTPEPVVRTLREIWYGPDIDDVRRKHTTGCVNDVAICKECPFKETYQWDEVGQ